MSPRLLNAVPVQYALREENGFQPSIDEIRNKITDRTKAIVLVSPNNPTGSVLAEEELADHIYKA